MISMRLDPRACPICGSRGDSRPFADQNVTQDQLDAFAFASRKVPEYMHWRLAECRRCDLLYADPAPSAGELASLYRDAGFASRDEARLAGRTYGRLLRKFLHRLPDRVGAADIGTGDGTFLGELLAAGFSEVSGIEPSRAPIEAAEPSIRPLIRHDVFRADSFPAGSLSLMTCFQTIEHLPDPLSFCRAAWRALKPGGVLFLVGHNRRAVSARILGRTSPIFDVEHLQLFSASSFRNLLSASGFSHASCKTIFNRYPIRYWAQLLPLPQPSKARLLPFLDGNPVGRLLVSLPAGNLAAVGYKGSSDESVYCHTWTKR